MAANATNRETVRDALHTLLNTALTGSGKPVEATYNYMPADFERQSPVLIVSTGGSRRQQHGMSTTRFDTWIRYGLMVFVMDADTSAGWTDLNVEDKLDEIEKAVADVIADNRSASAWSYLRHGEDYSDRVNVSVSGDPYVMEVIPVEVRVID